MIKLKEDLEQELLAQIQVLSDERLSKLYGQIEQILRCRAARFREEGNHAYAAAIRIEKALKGE